MHGSYLGPVARRSLAFDVVRVLVCLTIALALLFMAPQADARSRANWTKVHVRSGDDATRISATLKKLLKRASRKAKWGKGSKLELSARVTKLTWEKRDEAVLINVTVVAKIAGSKSARSHIRIGGRPNERRKLEKQALRIIADGLVTRLSAIARD